MNRLFKYTGVLFWVFVVSYLGYLLSINFPEIVKTTLQILGVILLILIGLRLYFGKDWIKNIAFEFVVGSDLIKATEKFLNEIPTPQKQTSANLVGHLVYRFTRLGIIGLTIALIPIVLLYNQNRLIEKQIRRLDQQTYLQEAERRGNLVFLFSNIMDAIDTELKEDWNNNERRDLSPQLIGRITALSQRLKPYYYLKGDSLTKQAISPERGQFLTSLIGSNLDTLTYALIYLNSSFSNADLEGIVLDHRNFPHKYLKYIKLNGANLKNAILPTDSKFSGANLKNANLIDANLYKADLRGANLVNTNLKRANLKGAELQYAKVNGNFLERIQEYGKDSIIGQDEILKHCWIYSTVNDTVLIDSRVDTLLNKDQYLESIKVK